MFVIPVKNTYCDVFTQIRGSLPFYELQGKKFPGLGRNNTQCQYFPKAGPMEIKCIFLT